MINKQLKMRLKKDRPRTTITMRVPADIVTHSGPSPRCAALRLITRF